MVYQPVGALARAGGLYFEDAFSAIQPWRICFESVQDSIFGLTFACDFLPFRAMACDLCGGIAFWRDRGGAAGGFVCLLCVVFLVSALGIVAHGRFGVCGPGFSDFGG